MRTTLDIAADVLAAVKERARREKRRAGAVLSDLARSALTAPPTARGGTEPAAVHGFRPFEPRGGLVTKERIDDLRDDDAC